MPFTVMDDVILKYFSNGFSYLEIAELLNHVHDFQISLSTLKRWLKDNNLRRRPLAAVLSSDEVKRQAVQEKLNGSGSIVGYRRVHRYDGLEGKVLEKFFLFLAEYFYISC